MERRIATMRGHVDRCHDEIPLNSPATRFFANEWAERQGNHACGKRTGLDYASCDAGRS
ncbi:hypothetical protein U0C82_18095 [Fulvimarina sp. 2208YS6-2-32]|uniref:Uncharacterized protein n=1 Tax=Fulvimarina uroteuthidis TaxID=3098149 RepID=A0ABU5I6N2_9HYPH|nr:hypothetical protein [Fulvimarina sp. 2208YS6-2-32]MDY8111043.1 hypothetical protein [Fulvimarina sp. 2208YS6-2-32]